MEENKIIKINENFKIINDNSLNMLDYLKPNSIDAIVCDPPYELGFMNKGWDSSGIAYNVELWKKAFEVLKPGGYLLAFGGSRTYHRVACAIEDAGFEIRDCIMWLYGSGFPKSQNIGLMIDKRNGVDNRTGNIKEGVGSNNTLSMMNGTKESLQFSKQYEERKAQNEWEGWGTCLKPAYEPIVMARKTFKGSLVDNVLKYRVGGLNIDECRIGEDGGKKKVNVVPNSNSKNCGFGCNGDLIDIGGRFPANVIHDGSEEVIRGMPDSKGNDNTNLGTYGYCFDNGKRDSRPMARGYDDEGSVSRYFYCAKASTKDRDEGLIQLEKKQTTDGYVRTDSESARKFGANSSLRRNIHPTVKPTELMQYLVRLVAPKGGGILDIFNGSGSTGKAVAFENKERNANYKYVGFELSEEYCQISRARIEYAINWHYEEEKEIEDEDGKKVIQEQMTLF